MREDITKYLSFILKNIWIVILSSGLLGGMVYLYFSSQDTNYSAQAKIFIGNALQPNTDLGEVDLGLRIAPTYAEFATTYNVMMNTIETLNLDLSVDQLRHKITTRIVVDTAILIIQVHDSDAEQAAVIANELARNLILESPSYLSEAEREQLQIQSDLISELQAQLAITQEQEQVQAP
jgi:receptor protein-tyrosine kinase